MAILVISKLSALYEFALELRDIQPASSLSAKSLSGFVEISGCFVLQPEPVEVIGILCASKDISLDMSDPASVQPQTFWRYFHIFNCQISDWKR